MQDPVHVSRRTVFDSHPTRRENRGRRTPYPTVHGRWIRRFETANVRRARHRAFLYACNVYAQGAPRVRRKRKRFSTRVKKTKLRRFASLPVGLVVSIAVWTRGRFEKRVYSRHASCALLRFTIRSCSALGMCYGRFPPEKWQNWIFFPRPVVETTLARNRLFFESDHNDNSTSASTNRFRQRVRSWAEKHRPAENAFLVSTLNGCFAPRTRHGEFPYRRTSCIHRRITYAHRHTVAGASRQTLVAPCIHTYVPNLTMRVPWFRPVAAAAGSRRIVSFSAYRIRPSHARTLQTATLHRRHRYTTIRMCTQTDTQSPLNLILSFIIGLKIPLIFRYK